MKIILPYNVKSILRELTAQGHEAYVVGGCVRDSLLSRTPGDWDITTSAQPEEVKAIFRRTVDTGIKHGTVSVLLGNERFEVTTYRVDGKYEDGRHPSGVTFTPELSEDLLRRDFTINAMAYNEERGIVDLFGGQRDLQSGIIRCVGDARERFEEDCLRILRAVRFCAQLGFRIEEKTLQAMRDAAPRLTLVSNERIRTEMTKLLLSPHPEELTVVYETGMSAVFLPELDTMMQTTQENKHHLYSVGYHSIKALESMVCLLSDTRFTMKEQMILRWAMLLHDVGKPQRKVMGEDGVAHFHGHQECGAREAQRIMTRLKFDNDTIAMTAKLVRYHDYRYELSPTGMRRAILKIGENCMRMLFEIQKADLAAKNRRYIRSREEILEQAISLYDAWEQTRECVSLHTLAVNGADLIRYGMKPGKQIGEVLRRMLSEVIETPGMNTKETLLALPWLESYL